MKQDKDWTDAMRSSLRDAAPTPPAGGWERLEGELGAVKPHVPAWRMYWPRIAAAAAVLLCIVAGELLLRGDYGVMTDGNVNRPMADGGGSGGPAANLLRPTIDEPTLALSVEGSVEPTRSDDPVSPVVPVGVQDVAGVSIRVAGRAAVKTAEAEPVSSGMGLEDVLDAAVAVNAGDPANAVAPAAEVVDESASAGSETASAIPPSAKSPATPSSPSSPPAGMRTSPGDNLRNAYGGDMFADNAPRRNKTSVGLFAGGGMIGSSEHAPLGRMFSGAMSSGEVVVNQKYTYSDYSFRHRLPLSFGLAVRKDFRHGLSLESGVNYTLLLSDVKGQYGAEDISQKLHFIGVPLRFNWRFFERNRFSLYMGAGGMIEKCVSAKFGSQSVDEPKVQWSALAAAGAQYRLGGVAALYFEPEASYYFTQTKLRTVRTDSSVAFTLRLGVRLSF